MATRNKGKPEEPLIDIMKSRNASEVVGAFMDWLKWADELQKASWQIVVDEDAKNQDFLHEFEFEKDNKKRAVIATRLHNSRVRRREAKDISKELKPVSDFIKEATARNHIKLLKKCYSDLKKEEEYIHSERVYKPRSKESDSDWNNN